MAIMRCIRLEPNRSMNVDEFKAWLRAYDDNHDGRISQEEFREALHGLRIWFGRWKAQKAMESADTDRSGTIDSATEMEKLLSSSHIAVLRALLLSDRLSSARISPGSADSPSSVAVSSFSSDKCSLHTFVFATDFILTVKGNCERAVPLLLPSAACHDGVGLVVMVYERDDDVHGDYVSRTNDTSTSHKGFMFWDEEYAPKALKNLTGIYYAGLLSFYNDFSQIRIIDILLNNNCPGVFSATAASVASDQNGMYHVQEYTAYKTNGGHCKIVNPLLFLL
ncbi:Serine/threonine-protein phosphatase [Artemisia annua]|uniref:Serine/threonine-protein phosphatase n=1 Tax=Artemisia annua TaxID=35608 RepID=A0A2U1P4C6_ARTAN|nr:Serine/threonine-protein phosphatase [Artemisia annua]